MSFGLARGLDYASFCKAVKKLMLVMIEGDKRTEVELPLKYYNVHVQVDRK